MDHVRKSYSVNDLSLESSVDYVDNRERMEDSDDDDEVDNRLIAERYNREVASSSGAHPQPDLDYGLI